MLFTASNSAKMMKRGEVCLNKEMCLEVESLTVRLANRVVLENINFCLNRGKFYTIIGPNGGGKTTLIKSILGLVKPVSGSIYIFGVRSEDYLREKTVGYVPQRSSSTRFPMKVVDVVRMGLIKGLSSKWKKEVLESLESVGMQHYIDEPIYELSGGQQQRVMIARAIVSKPELLMLDEPTVGLDIDSQKSFYELIKKLVEDLNITVIMATHDIGFVAEYSHGVLCINRRLVVHESCGFEKEKAFFNRLYGFNVKPVVHNHKGEKRV